MKKIVIKNDITVKQAILIAVALAIVVSIAIIYLGCTDDYDPTTETENTINNLYKVQIKIKVATRGGRNERIWYNYNVHRKNEIIKEETEGGTSLRKNDNDGYYDFINIGEYKKGDTINLTFTTGEYDANDEIWYRRHSTLYFYLNGKEQTQTYRYSTDEADKTASFTIE